MLLGAGCAGGMILERACPRTLRHWTLRMGLAALDLAALDLSDPGPAVVQRCSIATARAVFLACEGAKWRRCRAIETLFNSYGFLFSGGSDMFCCEVI